MLVGTTVLKPTATTGVELSAFFRVSFDATIIFTPILFTHFIHMTVLAGSSVFAETILVVFTDGTTRALHFQLVWVFGLLTLLFTRWYYIQSDH